MRHTFPTVSQNGSGSFFIVGSTGSIIKNRENFLFSIITLSLVGLKINLLDCIDLKKKLILVQSFILSKS